MFKPTQKIEQWTILWLILNYANRNLLTCLLPSNSSKPFKLYGRFHFLSYSAYFSSLFWMTTIPEINGQFQLFPSHSHRVKLFQGRYFCHSNFIFQVNSQPFQKWSQLLPSFRKQDGLTQFQWPSHFQLSWVYFTQYERIFPLMSVKERSPN